VYTTDEWKNVIVQTNKVKDLDYCGHESRCCLMRSVTWHKSERQTSRA